MLRGEELPEDADENVRRTRSAPPMAGPRTSPTIPPFRSRSSTSSSPTNATAPSTISGGRCSNTSTPSSSASPPRRPNRPSASSTRTSSPNTTTNAPSPMASTSATKSTASTPRSPNRAARSKKASTWTSATSRPRQSAGNNWTKTSPTPRRNWTAPSSCQSNPHRLQAFRDALFTELFPGARSCPRPSSSPRTIPTPRTSSTSAARSSGRATTSAKKSPTRPTRRNRQTCQVARTLIQEFRTSPQLRIAVTVDMIATGTDIKPLECLLFMRDVRSRIYFEQMKGRGTRVLRRPICRPSAARTRGPRPTSSSWTPSASAKATRPIPAAGEKPTVNFDKLLLGVALGKRDEDTLTTLAGASPVWTANSTPNSASKSQKSPAAKPSRRCPPRSCARLTPTPLPNEPPGSRALTRTKSHRKNSRPRRTQLLSKPAPRSTNRLCATRS